MESGASVKLRSFRLSPRSPMPCPTRLVSACTSYHCRRAVSWKPCGRKRRQRTADTGSKPLCCAMLSLLATVQGGASSPDDASHVCQVIDNVARASLHLQPQGAFSQYRPKGTEGTSSMTYFPLTKTQREWQER